VLAVVTAGATLATCTDQMLPSPPAPASEGAAAPLSSPEAEARVATVLGRFAGVMGPGSNDFEVSPQGGLSARLRAPGARSALAVDLSRDAAAPVRIRDERSGVAVAFSLQGASHAALAMASGYAIYPGAAPSGGDVLHRLRASGDEDYVYFAREPETKALRYTLDVHLAAGLRLFGGTLELLDAGGAPRLRVAPPVVIDAGGHRIQAALSLEGCEADTSPRGPWGRPVTPPGAGSCVMSVTWPDTGVRYPALVDPSWEQTSNMVLQRWGHAVAPLASLAVPPTLAYRVLVTGGVDQNGNVLSSAEIYEPLSQTFTLTSPMGAARVAHTATPIPGSATGQVLIAGGAAQVFAGTVPEHLAGASGTTEIYDEVGGTFTPGPAMGAPRIYHTATALVDGRVLLAGGTTDTGAPPTASADLFTVDASAPLGGAIAPALGPLNAARFGHAATLLSTGAVLITGGIGASGTALVSAETFCPINDCANFGADDNFFPTTTSMTVPRAFHTATGLHTGDVLVAGGASAYALSATYLATAELFTIGAFQGTSIPMTHARAFHTATKFAPLLVLPQGTGTGQSEVLVVGGFDGTADLASAEVFFPAAGSAPAALSATIPAAFSRRHAAAALVNDGASVGAGNGVLVMGGVSGSSTTAMVLTNGAPTSSAELFLKPIGDPCVADLECNTGYCADGFCCDAACGADCFSCAASLKADGTNDGVCGPSVQGLPLPVTCVSGIDIEVHSVCDGMGHAEVSATASIDCKPSTCGANNHCSTFCDDGADQCAASGWCNFAVPPDGGVPDGGEGDGGVGLDGGAALDGGALTFGTCQQKGLPGTTCSADDHCLAGFCYDGFCCDRACGDQCQACDVPGNEGTCTTLGTPVAEPVHPGGLHPRPACSGVGTSCTGLCAGFATMCTYPDGLTADGGVNTSEVFQSPDCADTDGGTLFVSYPCDGDGGHTEAPASCGGFACQDPHTCRTSCADDGDCIQDHICVFSAPGAATGTCQPLTGPLCDGDVTLRRPSDSGGNLPCPDHYACPTGATACNTSCFSVLDCASGYGCDDSHTCEGPLPAPSLPSCDCSTPGGDRAPSPAALAFVALAIAVSRRRRR
jgi:MYXO-CTERM domain-containing protein